MGIECCSSGAARRDRQLASAARWASAQLLPRSDREAAVLRRAAPCRRLFVLQGVRVCACPLFVPELTQVSNVERSYFFSYRQALPFLYAWKWQTAWLTL